MVGNAAQIVLCLIFHTRLPPSPSAAFRITGDNSWWGPDWFVLMRRQRYTRSQNLTFLPLLREKCDFKQKRLNSTPKPICLMQFKLQSRKDICISICLNAGLHPPAPWLFLVTADDNAERKINMKCVGLVTSTNCRTCTALWHRETEKQHENFMQPEQLSDNLLPAGPEVSVLGWFSLFLGRDFAAAAGVCQHWQTAGRPSNNLNETQSRV